MTLFRVWVVAIVFLASVFPSGWGPCQTVVADDAESSVGTSVRRPLLDYRSNHLNVRTDLAEDEAAALYARLERTLKFAARYWGREPRGQIECYVVENLDNWSDADLPHRLARVIVFGVGGATVPQMVGEGNQRRNEPVVYAASRRGIAEHELIHAYCVQTFGSGGPEWYKEGMAEMANGASTRTSGIQCSAEQCASLRRAKLTTVTEVLGVGKTRLRLSAALNLMLADPAHDGRHVSLAAWTPMDTTNVAVARDEYLRSWAFCYLLLHNPNYAKRFRAVGELMVNQQHEAFDRFFEPVRGELAFEYRFLLEHLAIGYRVDLCRWDWHQRFQRLQAGKVHRTRVAAARGFQASGVEVVAGQRYMCHASGEWQVAPLGKAVDADGGADNSGRLVGVVMNDFKLGTPFLLGKGSEFRASKGGHLYLRCNDAWSELGDNQGQLTVRLSLP